MIQNNYQKFFFILLILLALQACDLNTNKPKQKNNGKPEKKMIKTAPEPKLYGISLKHFLIKQDIVKRNQTLSDILPKYGISFQMIDSLVRVTDTLFNLKHIKAGNKYTVFLSQDTTPDIYAFVYEINPLSYYRVIFSDSLQVSVKKQKVHRITKSGGGIITSSLWNCVIDNGISPEIALQMSEIYAWSIDFFSLQRGDAFTVFYDELATDSQVVAIEKIHAAIFLHNSVPYYAFWFDAINDYFDENGNSLRKTFLKAPLRFNHISSRFSNSRFHPILKIYRPHHGIDYAAPKGTPVYALGDGKIIKKGYDHGGGNFIKIKHNSVYTTSYMHLCKFAKNINIGKTVKQGELIGYVGSTGLATGPHLDFRVYRNGSAIDPLKLESPPAEPVPDSLQAQFMAIKDSLKKTINNDFKKIYQNNIQ